MDSNDKYLGRILDNRYEILERIGTGGMAFVYKARCHRLNRLVAIKILKDDLASDEEFRRRFHTESQAVAMLSHPNIVAVYDVNRTAGTEYIVMELIEGITLKDYINRKGLLNWKETLHFTTQIVKALSHAHSRGIIHRDIKPHNIMILKDGSVKVADFGIARLLNMKNTLTREALGSVHYISPEQAKGGSVDARSDIYSVGVVMYEMLTSRLPFVGDSAVSVAIQHISAIPLMPRDINPDIPEGLENITMHAMEPHINLRFTTADEMLADLEEFRKNPAITFSYALVEKRTSGTATQETKVIPTAAVRKAEREQRECEFDNNLNPEKHEPLDSENARNPEQEHVRERAPAVRPRTRPVPVKKPRKPEMNRDEYRTVKKRANSTSMLIGIFSIVVFLIVVVVFMWRYMLSDILAPQQREPLVIPNFIGRMYDIVEADSEYAEIFSFVSTFRNSADHAAGIIFDQDPVAGTERMPPLDGRRVQIAITVSSGDEQPVEMPELFNMHVVAAQNTLVNLDLNLQVTIRSVTHDEITRDHVVETIPAVGEPLARGNAVIIYYSAGPDIREATIPDMRGYTVEDLRAEFNARGLVPDIRFVPSTEPAGTVLFIAGIGNQVQVPNVESIRVNVSLGPPDTTPDPDPPSGPDPYPDPNDDYERPPQIPPDTQLPPPPGDDDAW